MRAALFRLLTLNEGDITISAIRRCRRSHLKNGHLLGAEQVTDAPLHPLTSPLLENDKIHMSQNLLHGHPDNCPGTAFNTAHI